VTDSKRQKGPSAGGPFILPYGDLVPQIHPDAWVAPGAAVTGDVVIGEHASVWSHPDR